MQQEEKPNAHQKIRKFISKYAKPAAVFLAAVLVLFVVVEVINFANEKKAEKATALIEDIQTRLADALKEEQDISKLSLAKYQSYLDEIDGVIAEYPKEYAGLRALFMKGDMLYSFREYDKAAAAYSEFAAKYPDSYDAPIAIYNVGVCYENLGKNAEAEAEYLKIYNNYKDDYAMMPKLVFTLGRLAENSQKYSDAEKYYNQITAEYPESNYSLYGQDRIILMKSKGQL